MQASLAELRQQPRASWRLHHMAQLSATAIVIAQRANAVLADAGINLTLNSTNLAAVQQIASELSQTPIPRSA